MYGEVAGKKVENHKRTSITYRKSRGKNISRRIFAGNVFKASIFGFAMIFMCLTALVHVSATNSVDEVKIQYKSVLVEEGDTLWNIADAYNNQTLSCISNSEYIDDVMSINNISGDNITAGNYIIVPIYVGME